MLFNAYKNTLYMSVLSLQWSALVGAIHHSSIPTTTQCHFKPSRPALIFLKFFLNFFFCISCQLSTVLQFIFILLHYLQVYNVHCVGAALCALHSLCLFKIIFHFFSGTNFQLVTTLVRISHIRNQNDNTYQSQD